MIARVHTLLTLLLVSGFLSGAVGCGATRAARGVSDAQAFERLHAGRSGSWRTADGTVADYTLVSNDSALVESWVSPRGARTLTVYHPDGDEVLLTHSYFCPELRSGSFSNVVPAVRSGRNSESGSNF